VRREFPQGHGFSTDLPTETVDGLRLEPRGGLADELKAQKEETDEKDKSHSAPVKCAADIEPYKRIVNTCRTALKKFEGD
jgi:hypothetical protein